MVRQRLSFVDAMLEFVDLLIFGYCRLRAEAVSGPIVCIVYFFAC